MKSNEFSENALWNKSTFSLENVRLAELQRSVRGEKRKKKREQNESAPLEQNNWAFLKGVNPKLEVENHCEFIQIRAAVVAAR